MHPPTPPARRVAALRYQAEQLLRDAAAWGYCVSILPLAEADILRTDPVNVYVNIDAPPPPVFPPAAPFDTTRYLK